MSQPNHYLLIFTNERNYIKLYVFFTAQQYECYSQHKNRISHIYETSYHSSCFDVELELSHTVSISEVTYDEMRFEVGGSSFEDQLLEAMENLSPEEDSDSDSDDE